MYIRDPVFQDIKIDEVKSKLIDTSILQRLKYIKQMGFSYIVNMGATGTRFEHSLGTMKVTDEIASRIFPGREKENEELAIVGLLHDIGHTPFSHETEEAFIKTLHKTHEQIGYDLLNGEIRDIINDHGLSFNKIKRYFQGSGKGQIVTGPLGSDRIDYLIRDSYHTGVAYGVIDYTRIKNEITFAKNNVAIYDSGLEGAESMLIARYYMYISVYLHKTSEIAASMFRKALEMAIEKGEIDPNNAARYTDYYAMYELQKLPSSSEMINKILNRRIFKLVAEIKVHGKGGITPEEAASALSAAGLDFGEFTVFESNLKGANDDILVVDRHKKKLGNLSEISKLFNVLTTLVNERKAISVACTEKKFDAANAAIKKLYG